MNTPPYTIIIPKQIHLSSIRQFDLLDVASSIRSLPSIRAVLASEISLPSPRQNTRIQAIISCGLNLGGQMIASIDEIKKGITIDVANIECLYRTCLACRWQVA
ncbi:MAG: hypothetical protein IPL92_17535 [Saprospiraceae bacterium]|nr:hypothetical protein [Candidatus Opimibacter iunctus]